MYVYVASQGWERNVMGVDCTVFKKTPQTFPDKTTSFVPAKSAGISA